MFNSPFWPLAILAYAIVWFSLSHRLFQALAARHPKVFETLGKPAVFKSRSTRPLLRFLFSRDYEQMNDPEVAWLSRILLFVYVSTNVAFLIYVAFHFGWVKWG